MRTFAERIPTPMRMALMLIAALAGGWLALEHQSALAPAIESGGPGIVAFEFAASPERADEILSGWGTGGRTGAEEAIRIDYGFLIAYAVFLWLATAAVADRAHGRWARVGRWLAGLALVAGLLDILENTLLLRVIDGYREGSISGTATAAAAVAAGLKFAILAVIGLYMLSALLHWVGVWLSGARSGRSATL
jgi:hypothetical protein